MKGDLPAWALRLSTELPSVTHTAPPPRTYSRASMTRVIPKERRGRGRTLTGRGRGGHNAKGVVIDGRAYPSIKAAAKALGIGNTRIYAWIYQGRATYAKDHNDSDSQG